jgi:predicted MFS family arabinose efflux permease
LGISALRVGILFVFQGIGYVIGSMVSTRLSGYHAKKVIFYGLLVMISTLFGHLFAFDSAQMCWSQYLLLAFYGLGCGSVLPTLLSISLSDIPPIDAGSAAGLYSSVQQTAIALGVSLVGGVFFYFEEASGSKMLYLEGYRWATILNMVFLVIVLITLRKLPAACKASAP